MLITSEPHCEQDRLAYIVHLRCPAPGAADVDSRRFRSIGEAARSHPQAGRAIALVLDLGDTTYACLELRDDRVLIEVPGARDRAARSYEIAAEASRASSTCGRCARALRRREPDPRLSIACSTRCLQRSSGFECLT